MCRKLILSAIIVSLLALANIASASVITVSSTEIWAGATMHGITPSGSGTAGDPYVYVIPDGMSLTGSGVIKMDDKYVTFDFNSGTAGLDMASGSYFDVTHSYRLESGPHECTIILGDNNLTGTGDFKTVDILKNSMDVSISGSGDVTVNSFYMRTSDANPGAVSVDVGGSVNIGSVDTQDQDTSGNDGGDVTIGGADITIGDIDTRALRTDDSGKVSGNVVLEARDYWGNNTLENTVNLSGTINTDSAFGTDGDVTISGVVVTLEPGFNVITGGGSLDIYAGILQYGMTAGDLFIDNSGGGYSATHNVSWIVPLPQVTFETASSGDFETVSPATLTVSLKYPEEGNTYTVEYAASGGTATAGVDYTLTPGTLTFEPDETAETISIDIINDGADEEDETIVVMLSNPTGPDVILGSITEHTYTIIDPRPKVYFQTAASSGREDVSPVDIPVSLSWASGGTVTVAYAVSGGTATGGVDYTLTPGTLAFEPGETTETISITIIDDELEEENETIELTLSNPANVRLGDTTQHTFTIAESFFPSFPDSHTVALWLFDEADYPHTTLTDVSEYEKADLCLMDDGSMVTGKFGNALQVGSGYAVCYAGFVGKVPEEELREPDGTPSGLWGPTEGSGPLLNGLAGNTWTVELWLNLSSAGSGISIIDLGWAYDPGVSLTLNASSMELVNYYAGVQATCPTTLSTGTWHHVAFTRDGSTVRHFIDGIEQAAPTVSSVSVQPIPDLQIPSDREHEHRGFMPMSFEQRRQNRFNFAVGTDRYASGSTDGKVDEMRISDVVRYSGNFTPQSFSRNYGPGAPGPSVANGLPLLFDPGPSIPLELGARKHVFIDDAVIDTMSDLQITMNQAYGKQELDFPVEDSKWRPSVFDVSGVVYMAIPESYGSTHGTTRLATSPDGLVFTMQTPIITETPLYASFFKDLNPNIAREEQYKANAFVANRGMYMYVSPDGLNWRRNETIQLPLRSGGEGECFWDDQRGRYASYIKRDSSFDDLECADQPGRVAVGFWSNEILKGWPFNDMETPYFEGYPFPSVTCEGPVEFGVTAEGQVYRTRAIKYPWAPDTYLAFVWRYLGSECRQVDLGVSRDGENWMFYTNQDWYIDPDGANEVLSLYGLIRRGDEIWQYAEYGTGCHGDGARVYARLKQRLDGFVSLDAGGTTGTATTLPMVFQGDALTLNIAATGSAKVAITNEAGQELSGFALTDCDPITTDSVRHVVTWQNNSDVSSLAGSTVRLRFEMQNTKLYAFQFTLYGDFDNDGNVGMTDLAIFVLHWLENNFSPVGQLVAWWEFDEGGGTIANDSAGDSNGTLNGDPNWTTGQVGTHALDFDGDGDYVDLDSHISNIEGLNEGTIAGWFKSSEDRRHFLFTITEGSTNNNKVQVILGPAGSGYDDEGFAFMLKRGGSDKLMMFVRNGEYAYTDGEWHHFAVCTGGGDNRIYIDGVSQSITFSVGSSSTNEFSNIENPTSMKIGVRVRNNTYGNYLDGILDDVRIYDYELNAEEATRVYEGLPLEDRFVCAGSPVGDLNGDCEVTFGDFAGFASHWTEEQP